MENEGRLYSQVAAEAGVPIEQAMVACYLLQLSRQGKTLDEAADLTRKQRYEVRDHARDWGISFADYMMSPQPLAIVWTKPKRGLWELKLDGLLIAAAVSDGDGTGAYTAKRETHDMTEYGSSAEIAMRRLSIEIERRSVEIFGVDDVQIWIEQDGARDLAAPRTAEDPDKLRRALAA